MTRCWARRQASSPVGTSLAALPNLPGYPAP